MCNSVRCLWALAFLALCLVVCEGKAMTREVTTFKKWYPGHYLQQEADDLATNSPAFNTLKGPNGDLFQGIFMYKTWVTMEPWYHAWNWTSIYTLLNALPVGKKLLISLSIQPWRTSIMAPYGTTPGPGQYLSPCPQDMHGVEDPYDGGWRYKDSRPFSTMHMPATMNRFLEFVEAFAKEFDEDERVAVVMTHEIPYDPPLKTQKSVWPWNNQYNADTFAANLMLMADTFPKLFNRTVTMSLGAWWSASGGAAARADYADRWLRNGGGFGVPDCFGKQHSQYNSDFRTYLVANAGKWPVAMGFEWADYLTEVDCNYFAERGDSREAACWAGTLTLEDTFGTRPWPSSMLDAGAESMSNFYWWHTANRATQWPKSSTGRGGEGLTTDTIPFLRANSSYGLTTIIPSNLLVNITTSPTSSSTTSPTSSSSSSSSSSCLLSFWLLLSFIKIFIH